jgi:type VI secretion system secreted protein Hcp
MASDYLLKLAMVKGESLDDRHKESIELNSWTLAAANPTRLGSGGLSAGKASFTNLQVTFDLERASVALLERLSAGKAIGTVTLYCRKSGDDKRLEYLKIDLSEAVVSTWDPKSPKSGIGIPTVVVSFSFSKIEYTYQQYMGNALMGSPLKTTWDLKAQKK